MVELKTEKTSQRPTPLATYFAFAAHHYPAGRHRQAAATGDASTRPLLAEGRITGDLARPGSANPATAAAPAGRLPRPRRPAPTHRRPGR